MDFYNLQDFELKGKTVLIRVDINSPIEGGKIVDSERIAAHSETVKFLVERKAKVVVIAHQGRAGDRDFVSLRQHATLLSKHVGKTVSFYDELFSEKALETIGKLKNGQVLLLENTRFYSEETLEKSPKELSETILVKALAKACDLFVFDAFSAAHRSQSTVVGFCFKLPSAAGLVMQRELENISKVISSTSHPNVYILGGAKPDDCIKLLKSSLENGTIDKILTMGVLGELCAIARGTKLPTKWALLEKNGWTKSFQELKGLLQKYSTKIESPSDFAFSDGGKRREIPSVECNSDTPPVFDVGGKTIEKYKNEIKKARAIYLKGPAGNFEEKPFESGTKEIFWQVANTDAFVLVGGGHTVEALKKFKLKLYQNSFQSIAGGALIALLCGENFPAVEALKESKKLFGNGKTVRK